MKDQVNQMYENILKALILELGEEQGCIAMSQELSKIAEDALERIRQKRDN